MINAYLKRGHDHRFGHIQKGKGATSSTLKAQTPFSVFPFQLSAFCCTGRNDDRGLKQFVIISILFFLVLLTSQSRADDQILGGTDIAKQYLIELNGTVMNETFNGAQALLNVLPPNPGSFNPYQVVIIGFPKKNSRNSFYWNSEDSEMTVVSNDITCDIKRTFVKPVSMYFVFMSPELLAHTGVLKLYGDEGKKFAEKVALPNLIYARAGKLKLRAYSNSVSGSIWMKGYDTVEKAFVQYMARFSGKRSYNLEPKQELRK